ncbi:ATP-dependent helicase [Arachis hypogaea]|nr:ATP-dependent helicase [Arachis hypogaea]
MSKTTREDHDDESSLLDIVFSWTLKDVLNDNLYKHKVVKIPETFNSVKEYMTSFVPSLIEETRSDICSGLKGVSRARFCEIKTVKMDKEFFEPPKNLFYLLTLVNTSDNDDVDKDDVEEGGEIGKSYELMLGDVIAFTPVRPKCIDDLNSPKNFYHIGYVVRPKRAYDNVIPILSSKLMETKNEYDRSGGVKKLYAVHLMNILTNVRIWKALNSQLEDADMSIIEKVLRPDTKIGRKCQICPSELNVIGTSSIRNMIQSQNLNESQEDAVSSCVSMTKCHHNSTINLVWGPPGTGKTKTVACILFSLLKLRVRTLTCAPTNTAVMAVASRLHSLVKDSLEHESYGFGDIVLFGNSSRMKVDSYLGLKDIFLENRVNNLVKCFAPLSGWKHSIESMIQLIKEPKKLYKLYQKEEGLMPFKDFVKQENSTVEFHFLFLSSLVCEFEDEVLSLVFTQSAYEKPSLEESKEAAAQLVTAAHPHCRQLRVPTKPPNLPRIAAANLAPPRSRRASANTARNKESDRWRRGPWRGEEPPIAVAVGSLFLAVEGAAPSHGGSRHGTTSCAGRRRIASKRKAETERRWERGRRGLEELHSVAAVTGVLRPPGPPPEFLVTSAVAEKNLLPLPLEVAAGLPPSRFGDRHCVGSSVPPSVRLSFGCCMLRLELLRLLRKWLGTEVLVAGAGSKSQLLRVVIPLFMLLRKCVGLCFEAAFDFELRQKELMRRLDYGFAF